MPAPPPPAAPNICCFTLDSAYAHALLAPRAPSMLPRNPPPDRPQVVREINPHLTGK